VPAFEAATFEKAIMDFVFRTVRGFMNVTGSGLLLLIAVSMFVSAANVPAGGLKGGSWEGALAMLGATLFSGFLTIVFWTQRAGRRSYHSSAILNGLSTVAFLSVIIIWAMDR
jgi:predicted neutral ceramidase superfamily lipid hydrolase